MQTWTAEWFQNFFRCFRATFEMGHHPLVTLLGKSPTDLLLPHIQWFMLWLIWFDYETVRAPRRNLVIADALSMAPQPDTISKGRLTIVEVISFANRVMMGIRSSPMELEQVREAQRQDKVKHASS